MRQDPIQLRIVHKRIISEGKGFEPREMNLAEIEPRVEFTGWPEKIVRCSRLDAAGSNQFEGRLRKKV